MIATTDAFKRCSTCKEPIGFDTRYYLCGVSTCNKKRMTLVFCSVSCWDAHQADARHRDAGAEEARSPSAAVWAKEVLLEKDRSAAKNASAGPVEMHRVTGAASLDILVIGAKLKEYIHLRAGMSTSDRCLGLLSDHLRKLCDRAIEAAGKDGRRTVMDRDVTPLVTRGLESRATGAGDTDDRLDDVIIVISKLKAYVKARAGMNTADSVPAVLSTHVRLLARQAIRVAGTDDRRTVLDRDFTQALSRDKA